jgi:hypothetical protein
VPYELRICYDPATPIGEADVRSRHGSADPFEAARAFVECSAPFKQIVFEEDGVLSELDAVEEAYLRGFVDGAGYEMGEVGG